LEQLRRINRMRETPWVNQSLKRRLSVDGEKVVRRLSGLKKFARLYLARNIDRAAARSLSKL
jgi:hypothetical protein